ncbi:MAG: hypothetical protein IIZ92_12620 [Aquincola sp.]|nr:hypothetical protein [Aquincola sp.]
MTTAEIPNILARFDEEIGARHWQQRVKQIRGAVKAKPLLEDLLHRENAIPFGLVECGELLSRYGGQMPSGILASRPGLCGAMSFSAQALSMLDLADDVQRTRLTARICNALTNPDAMRALRLELSTATHFARRGFAVEWPEMSGAGNFDLLIHGLGTCGLEVECKSVSQDKGRAIHREEALEMHELLRKELKSVSDSLLVGLAVVVTVPKRLPKAYVERRALAQAIRRQITMGRSDRLPCGTDIRIEQFDATIFRGVVEEGASSDDFRSKVEQVTRTRNREAVVIGRKGGGLVIVVLQGAGDDGVLTATFKSLSEAARRQLSGTRPALLIAGFDGLDDRSLQSIARQDHDPQQQPTSLAQRVSEFLTADHRPHVIGVCFFSATSLRDEGSFIGSGGAAYYFPKRQSPFWTDDLSGLFGERY